jgi:hypothetical protein
MPLSSKKFEVELNTHTTTKGSTSEILVNLEDGKEYQSDPGRELLMWSL